MQLRKQLDLELDRIRQDKQIKEHRLTTLFWECTTRCNQQCLHCGGDCRVLDGLSDMPRQHFTHVLDDICRTEDPHSILVVLAGGEPLLRTDIEQCGREAASRGFRWGIQTNGSLLSPTLFRSLVNAGLSAVFISLDGLSYEHNWLHGSANAFDATSSAIQLVASQPDIMLEVMTCVNKRNFDYLPQIKEYIATLGAQRWKLYTAYPNSRAKDNKELSLEAYQLRQLMEFIKKCRSEKELQAGLNVSFGCEGFLGDYEGEVRDYNYSCQAGISVGSLRAGGGIGGCLSVGDKYTQGNIFEGDEFMDVWNTCFSPFRNREWMRTGICTHCKVFRFCRGGGMHMRDNEGDIYNCSFCMLEK